MVLVCASGQVRNVCPSTVSICRRSWRSSTARDVTPSIKVSTNVEAFERSTSLFLSNCVAVLLPQLPLLLLSLLSIAAGANTASASASSVVLVLCGFSGHFCRVLPPWHLPAQRSCPVGDRPAGKAPALNTQLLKERRKQRSFSLPLCTKCHEVCAENSRAVCSR
jgi:hypothetical protein